MTTATTEQAFEEAIEKSLIDNGGYAKGNPSDFSRERGNALAGIIGAVQQTFGGNDLYPGVEQKALTAGFVA